MHRIDNSRFLLYIEPQLKDKSSEANNDEYTQIMELALSESQEGTANYSNTTEKENFRTGGGYKGTHQNCDGMRSSNHDYLLKNGMITNSLCVHYLQYFRKAIPVSEMNKVWELYKFYTNKKFKEQINKIIDEELDGLNIK
jgi:hypothetical protein